MASTSDDELEYLAPSFDPATLTVPKLRSVLLTHDITYLASAKKPQLIQLFNEELKPRSRKILAARSRIRRTSKGITNMPSSQESTVNGDDDASMLPPPVPDTTRRRSRKSSKQPSEDPTSDKTATPAVSRKDSTKHPRQSDTDLSDAEVKRPAVRKTRKSEVQSLSKPRESKATPLRPTLEKSPFSDENPFQSGSSPLAPGDHRRKSTGPSVDRRKSTSRRRKTDAPIDRLPQQDGVTVPSSTTFNLSVAQRPKASRLDGPLEQVEPGEDFTPEEQLELTKDRAANGGLDLSFPRTKHARKTGSGTIPNSAPWMVLIALLSGYALWLRKEKVEVGYCGVGKISDSIAGLHIPDWASLLQPQCEPCPQHAYCYENMDTRCEPDFVLTPHPLSLAGLVPLPPTCEPDGDKARKIKVVADKAVEELRERNAKSECGTLNDEQGKSVRTSEIDEQDLKNKVAKSRRKDMSQRDFDDLWKGALGEIVGREEVVQNNDGHRNLLTSNSLARIPFTCGVRRSFRLALARYRIELAVFVIIAYSIFYARNRIMTLRSDSARVPMLVSTTLDRMATQAALYNRGEAPESWISIGQLRDDVLRDEFSAKRREALWKRVRAVVEMNANVRASERELRAGDVSRVWEWIGNLGLVDDAWAEGGRRSGVRFSLGDKRRDSVTPNGRALEMDHGSNEMVEKRHWDEGRPIY
ncbi:MAG: hypothetical protein Q9168_001599 [Polycauliona sp. 1 TL-2023]